ncbi:MAG: glycosyltransferase family 4 protein [Actinomycetota bacterium]|jgi:glycosyltransferase involved in cell wall biosynthesis|nr:glycosyltransferase family 4 protein [Actinomycetota bacterium]
MRVAYVVPRYGPQVTGGAETGARMFAERLVSERRWQVEVYTTCALDHLTWDDVLAPGTETIAGVRVHRFASRAGRDPGFHPFSGALLADPESASFEEAERWVDLQGPITPELVDAVARSDADVVVFYPYLYYPTVRGVPAVAGPVVMHPAAHDEPALRLPVFPPVFHRVDGFVFQTRGERRLVTERFGVGAVPQVLLGLGVEERPGDPQAARQAFGLGDAPYLLCLGRVDHMKGTDLLAHYFSVYKERHGTPLKLVLAGPVIDPPDPHPDVVVAGIVDETSKWGLLRTAAALVSPSPWEAFSLVVVEAMACGTPVLVHAGCAATREHCEQSAAGMWFGGYGELEVAIELLSNDRARRAAMGDRGRRYVDRHFRWPVILDRYTRFLSRVAELAQRSER